MRKLFYTFICLLFFMGTSFGASVILNPEFSAQVAGVVVSGGKVHTCECGTTTAKTTYTTYDGGTANANPVILDTDGRAPIYCKGCLKIIVKTSADVTLWTVDNIYSFDNSVIQDADRDTIIQCEESADEDIIRFDVGGSQKMYITSTGVYITGTVYDEGYGRLERPKFRWKDADEIYIGAGAYHHSGTSEQFVYWNSEITFELEAAGSNALSDDYGADGWHYIYLDDSAIVTQAAALLDADCFLNDTTAPSWSATKHGFYNGNDRCIFAVYETGSAITEFHHMGDDYVQHADQIATVAATNIGHAAFADATALRSPGFSQKSTVTFKANYVDAESALAYRTNGQTGSTGIWVLGVIAGGTQTWNSVDVITDSSQLIEWVETDASTNTYLIYTNGWYLPVGM